MTLIKHGLETKHLRTGELDPQLEESELPPFLDTLLLRERPCNYTADNEEFKKRLAKNERMFCLDEGIKL